MVYDVVQAMDAEKAFDSIYQILVKRGEALNEREKDVFIGAWNGKTYSEISNETFHDEQYLRETGSKLFEKIYHTINVKVNKRNFRLPIETFLNQNISYLGVSENSIDTRGEQSLYSMDSVDNAVFAKFYNPNSYSHQISNPFIPIKGVIDNSQLFFNQVREIQWIFETLNSGSSVAIIGEKHIGKSSLLMEISRQAQTQLFQPRKPIYLNLEHIHDEDDFYQALCDYAEIEVCKGYRLTRNLKNHRLLLIIDKVEKIIGDSFTNELIGQLRALAERININAPLRLVLGSRTSLDNLSPDNRNIAMTSPLAGICIEYKLEKWDEKTIRDFINTRLNSPLLKPEYQTITFTEDEITELINQSEGHPQKLMTLCHQTFDCYLEKLS